jgi:hypothetical protein
MRIVGGNGVTLTYSFAENPTTDWSIFKVRMGAFDGWRIDGGRIATEAEIKGVLTQVDSFQIRGEYLAGADTADLDSVKWTEGKDVKGDGVAKVTADDVRSTFKSGGEGWGFRADVEEFRHQGTGGKAVKGNTGHIEAEDRAVGDIVYFVAPDAFGGVKSGFYGGKLSFSLRADRTDTPITDPLPDVIITGGGMTLVVELEGDIGTDWTDYSARLAAKQGWKIGDLGGANATKADITAVLANITDLQIRCEFRIGVEVIGLDEVRLSAPNKPYDVLDFGGNLLAMSGDLQAALNASKKLNGDKIVMEKAAAGDFSVKQSNSRSR